jgi:hypothetical protein
VPQGWEEEKDYVSLIQHCSSKVLDGLCSTQQLSTLSTTAALAFGTPSTTALVCNTESSSTTAECAALTPTTLKVGAGSNICYNYGRAGHYIRECTAPRQIATPRPQGHINHPPCGQPKIIATRTDSVNYTTIKDVPKGKQVLVGTFSLNEYPIDIFFDSGATHDFISKACTQKCQLAISHTNISYMISTPGGNIITKQLVLSIPLNLAGKIYQTHLIVLDGQEIDVIPDIS